MSLTDGLVVSLVDLSNGFAEFRFFPSLSPALLLLAIETVHLDSLCISVLTKLNTMASSAKSNSKADDLSLAHSSSASSITITPNLRRSDRLQTPHAGVQTSSRVLHRTVSRGVIDVHSPKLSSRKSNSFRRVGLNDRAAPNARHTSMNQTTDIQMTDEESDDDRGLTAFAPFELSDDETNGISHQESNERSRPTRAEVLKHFIEEPDGFRCNLCQDVSSPSRRFRANVLSAL